MDWKHAWKRFWHFIWEEDSVASWLANIVLAFVLIKFIVYPGLGLVFGTSHPVVAVVSSSMEHDGNFDNWWQYKCPKGSQGVLYEPYGISHEDFQNYWFRNGFNKGDIMVLWNWGSIDVGDVMVFNVARRGDPIIHRVVAVEQQLYKTKGDNNCGSAPFEQEIQSEQVIGKAVMRIPYLGWVKLGFTQLVSAIW
ncbi:MAG: hypothetical protein ACE5FT_03565 [Candidatus Nanoarchaeia archaeon]